MIRDLEPYSEYKGTGIAWLRVLWRFIGGSGDERFRQAAFKDNERLIYAQASAAHARICPSPSARSRSTFRPLGSLAISIRAISLPVGSHTGAAVINQRLLHRWTGNSPPFRRRAKATIVDR